jgi:hypothetical protein
MAAPAANATSLAGDNTLCPAAIAEVFGDRIQRGSGCKFRGLATVMDDVIVRAFPRRRRGLVGPSGRVARSESIGSG